MKPATRRWIFDVTVWIVGMVAVAMLVAEATAGERSNSANTREAWTVECGGDRADLGGRTVPAPR